MPILNYTTKVPVQNTVNEIGIILQKAGANAIMYEYDTVGISGLKFRMNTKIGEVFYNMPVNINGVIAALRKDGKYRDAVHAHRVAWRIAKDWIEAQMAIVVAGMAEVPEVFLPYAITEDGTSVYRRICASGMKLLEGKQ